MIYDISMLIEPNIQVYKNNDEKRPVFRNVSNFQNGIYETSLSMNLHTGTHVDFPLHVVPNGPSSDSHSIESLMGNVRVLDLTLVEEQITISDLLPFFIEENDFLLFKTKNSFSETFLPNFVYLSASAADYLKKKRVRGVGTDGLGIERNQPNHPTHHFLLDNSIIIIEGLRLKQVLEGDYQMICLPLKIKGVEALPARVLLMDDENLY